MSSDLVKEIHFSEVIKIVGPFMRAMGIDPYYCSNCRAIFDLHTNRKIMSGNDWVNDSWERAVKTVREVSVRKGHECIQ